MRQRDNVDDPEGLCASIGRAKYGKRGFQEMARRGRGNPEKASASKKPIAKLRDGRFTKWITRGVTGHYDYDKDLPPVGTMFIQDNETGEIVEAGYWMDFAEGESEEDYKRKPIRQRAMEELKRQKSYGFEKDFDFHRRHNPMRTARGPREAASIGSRMRGNPGPFAEAISLGVGSAIGGTIGSALVEPLVSRFRRSLKGYTRNNPSTLEAAQALAEEFHGREATEIHEYEDIHRYHSDFAG
ncbi:MAG: hypothetical protein L0Y56_18140, partial [Nitrospira sp.]|nr:hypothetical protein [Nitrospira sp.]